MKKDLLPSPENAIPLPDDIPVAIRRAILESEASRVKQDRYILTFRYRTNINIKNAAAAEECKTLLVNCEATLADIANELEKLKALPDEETSPVAD